MWHRGKGCEGGEICYHRMCGMASFLHNCRYEMYLIKQTDIFNATPISDPDPFGLWWTEQFML